MDNRERVLTALAWEEPDQVPLTTYDWMVHRGAAERETREAGLCLIHRLPPHREEFQQVTFSQQEFRDQGRRRIRHTIHTPVGEVSQVVEPGGAYGTTWIVEHYIKRPEDYRVMEFYYQDPMYRDNYAAIRQAQEDLGGDGLVMVRVAKQPIQQMVYHQMGMERFSIDLYERRELIDSLSDVMTKRIDERWDFAAESPAEVLQEADNMTSLVVSQERYRQYCMPLYEKTSRRLAGTGKLQAVHMDGKLRHLSKAIAESSFDIVEALTPTPVGDVSVKEAREAWPDKALWLNYTSSVHVQPDEEIEAHTRQLIEEAGTRRGFIIGITEDVPYDHVARSLRAILRVIRDMR
ncbi:MAG: hypothetical protein HYY04_09735 [Chloroflexi bacterium]|nr:hypothetical protein [Chloroflexota bacterium]